MKLNKDIKIKDIKIKVHSPEHSAAIQNRLFELGASWSHSDTKVVCVKALYLFVTGNTITHSSDYHIFISDINCKQATLDDLYNPSFLTNDSCNGKTVEIDGKRYKLVLEE
jgi:hypothetical protein